MSMKIKIEQNNTQQVLNALETQKERILTTWAEDAEGWAKENLTNYLAAGNDKRANRGYKLTGNLRNRIKGVVDGDAAKVGSEVYYAPYIELGTITKFEPPPEWIEYTADKGTGQKRTGGITPAHFLRDAILKHVDDFKRSAESILKGQ